MERTGHISGILTRLAAALLAVMLLTAALNFVWPVASFAAEKKDEDKNPETERLYSDAMTVMVLIQNEIAYASQSSLFSEIIKNYNEKYIRDHKSLANVLTPEWRDFASVMRPAEGYRGSAPQVYSELYKGRIGGLKDTLSQAAFANAEEALRIKNKMQEEIKMMNGAADSARGYISMIQAGTQEANYLNLELMQLRSDTLRQIDVQMSASIEEAQDDFDETSAFEGAVAAWKSQASGAGY